MRSACVRQQQVRIVHVQQALGRDTGPDAATSSGHRPHLAIERPRSVHCLTSHIPFTFLWKQFRSPTAPRLVKFSAHAAALLRGCSSNVPTSDHVPELMYAQSLPVAGMPAIADAVSWHAGAISVVSAKAANSAAARSVCRCRCPAAPASVRSPGPDAGIENLATPLLLV